MRSALLVLSLVLSSAVLAKQQGAQVPEPKPAGITLPDEAANQRVFGSLPAQVLAQGLTFSEGPLWVPEAKTLLICDLGAGELRTIPFDPATPPASDAQPLKPDLLLVGSGNAAGACLDASGRLLLARFNGSVARSSTSLAAILALPVAERSLTLDVLAEASDAGVKLARCNDIILSTTGDALFTDFGSPDSKGLFTLALADEPKATCLDPDIKAANGLCLDAPRKRLYVAEFAAKRVLAYPVRDDGSIDVTARTVHVDFSSIKSRGTCDGMKVDGRGRLLTTGPGGIYCVESDGLILAHLPISGASNLCIGPVLSEDDAGVTHALFITAGQKVHLARFIMPKQQEVAPAAEPAPSSTPPAAQ